MNWQPELSKIENPEFDIRLNVVSSAQGFFKALAKDPSVIELYIRMVDAPDAGEEVLGLIYDLSHLAVDGRYENPKDTQLAALLWLAYFAKPDYVQIAASYVARAPQCWYAKKLAHRILNPPPVSSGASWVWAHEEVSQSAPTSSGDTVITIIPMTQHSRPGYHREAIAAASTDSPVGTSYKDW